MMYPLSKSRATGISDKKWAAIQKLVAMPNTIMVYGEDTVDHKLLMRISMLLAIDGIAQWRLHVYHSCSKDMAEIRDWKDGLGYGELCRHCEKPFEEDNTLYSLEVIIKYPVIIVE